MDGQRFAVRFLEKIEYMSVLRSVQTDFRAQPGSYFIPGDNTVVVCCTPRIYVYNRRSPLNVCDLLNIYSLVVTLSKARFDNEKTGKLFIT